MPDDRVADMISQLERELIEIRELVARTFQLVERAERTLAIDLERPRRRSKGR
jgi:hypothetical protein